MALLVKLLGAAELWCAMTWRASDSDSWPPPGKEMPKGEKTESFSRIQFPSSIRSFSLAQFHYLKVSRGKIKKKITFRLQMITENAWVL